MTREGVTDAETIRLGSDDDDDERRRWLIVLGAAGSTAIELVPGAALRVGRASDSDVSIADDAVSRHHATVHVGETVEIEDAGSANGVFVGGARVPSGRRAELPVGSVAKVGRAMLVVHVGREAPAVDAEPPRASVAPPPRADVARDEVMARLYETAARVAPTRLCVLVLGETGTGKELLATELHTRSGRARGPLVKVNCAALASQLLESELFGHERGAFTGADRSKTGLVEAADGGTLFLDEVGEMPLELQAKLLRVVEDGIVKRVGAVTGRAVDVRFVSATNRVLEDEVARGAFRRDLYYRLKGVVLELPPLRARRGEILPLAERFLAEAIGGAAAPSLSHAARDALLAHDWPGNVRELRQAMEHALALRRGASIEPGDLPSDVTTRRTDAPAAAGTLRGDLASIEKQRIVDALAACDGNQTKAAALLGMPRRTLIARIEQYALPRPRK